MKDLKSLATYIKLEVKVDEIEFKDNFYDFVKLQLLPNFNILGEELGSKLGKVIPLIKKLKEEQI